MWKQYLIELNKQQSLIYTVFVIAKQIIGLQVYLYVCLRFAAVTLRH